MGIFNGTAMQQGLIWISGGLIIKIFALAGWTKALSTRMDFS